MSSTFQRDLDNMALDENYVPTSNELKRFLEEIQKEYKVEVEPKKTTFTKLMDAWKSSVHEYRQRVSQYESSSKSMHTPSPGDQKMTEAELKNTFGEAFRGYNGNSFEDEAKSVGSKVITDSKGVRHYPWEDVGITEKDAGNPGNAVGVSLSEIFVSQLTKRE